MIHQWLSGLVSWQEAWPHCAAFVSILFKSSIIVFLAGIGTGFLKNRSARARNWIWRVAFCGLIGLMLWQVSPSSWRERSLTLKIEPSLASIPQSAVFPAGTSAPPEMEVRQIKPTTTNVSAINPKVSSVNALKYSSAGMIERLLPFLLIGVSALLILVYAVRVVAGSIWLRRSANSAPTDVEAIASALGSKIQPLVFISPSITTPLLTGWFRPFIYLPESSRQWNDRKLRSVFQHEMAHWNRGDGWWQSVASIVTFLYWWNPLSWLSLRRLKAEAEEAADDVVVLNQEEPYLYAQSLVEIAAEPSVAIPQMAAIPILGESPLELRVRCILKTSFQRGKLGAWGMGILTVLTAVMLICIGCHVSANKEEKLDPRNTGKLALKIMNEDDKPVEGVIVQPWDLMSEKPKDASFPPSFTWEANTPNVPRIDVTTNEQGETDLVYPKILINGMPPESIITYFWHPDYCVQWANVYVNGKNPVLPIRLYKGTTVTVDVEPVDGVSFSEIQVQSFGQSTVPTYWSRVAEYRFVTHLKEQEFRKEKRLPIRVVAIAKDGRRYFSKTVLQTLPKEGAVHLTFSIKPGRKVEGVLDSSVPRPIKNGMAAVRVLSGAEGGPDDPECMNNWTASTAISKDGHFTFTDLPEGKVALLAFSDGYASKNAVNGGDPQAGTVPMQPTGSARVTVRTEDGKPAVGVIVGTGHNLTPGAFWVWSPYLYPDSAQFLTWWVNPTNKKPQFPKDTQYTKTTDASGSVLFENVPIGQVKFYSGSVLHSEKGTGNTDLEITPKSTTTGEIILVRDHSKDGQKGKPVPSVDSTTISALPMSKVTIQVVDQDGKPIAGVKFDPKYLRMKEDRGSSYGWGYSEKKSTSDPVAVVTNAEGKADVIYPETYVDGLHPSFVGGRLTHPDFVASSSEVNVSSPNPMQMRQGSLLSVSYEPVPGVKLGPAYVDLAGRTGVYFYDVAWSHENDGLGISARVLANPASVRAVAEDDQGRVYFGEAKAVALLNDAQKLQFKLKPGHEVRGTLDESVPRPVKNGRVIASIETPCPENGELKHHWYLTANVAEDGSFILKSVPEGKLELIAVCNGYVSKQPAKIQFKGIRAPQVMASTGPVRVEMEATGTAEIVVRDPSGKPLADATVSFNPNQIFNGGTNILGDKWNSMDRVKIQGTETKAVTSQKWNNPYAVKTNTDGVAIINNLPSGQNTYYVSHLNYEMPIQQRPPNTPRRQGSMAIAPSEKTRVEVAMEKKGASSLSKVMAEVDRRDRSTTNPPPSETPGDLKIDVQQSSVLVLSGQIVDTTGKPLEGVSAVVWPSFRNAGYDGRTDMNGRFKIEYPNMTSIVELRFTKEGYSPIYAPMQPVGTLTKPLVMNSENFLKGGVTNGAGKPAAGVKVTALSKAQNTQKGVAGDVSYSTLTDDNGLFKLFVHPDQYEIRARSDSGTVDRLSPVLVPQNKDAFIRLNLQPALTMRIRLKDSRTGKPVSGVGVNSWPRNDFAGKSDAEGLLVFSGLMPGEYAVQFDKDDLIYRSWRSPQATVEWERDPLNSTSGMTNGARYQNVLHYNLDSSTSEIEIFMEEGVTIRGKVLDPDGKSFAGAQVRLGAKATDTSGEDGSFELKCVANGAKPYQVSASDGWRNKFQNKWAMGYSKPLALEPGQNRDDVTITLTRPCTIRGMIVDASGKPLPRQHIEALCYVDGEIRSEGNASSGDDGRFEMQSVTAGVHYLQVGAYMRTRIFNGELDTQGMTKVVASPEKPLEDVRVVVDK